MKRALRFLWFTYISTLLAVFAGVSAVFLLCTQWLRLEFFATYYYMLPMMAIIFVTVFAFSLTTIYRNMALSMGCRRADFFRGCQLASLVTSVGGGAVIWLAGALPELLGLEYAFQRQGSFLNGAPVYVRPDMWLYLVAVCLLVQPMGMAVGGLYGRSKVWGVVCIAVVSLLGTAGTVILFFVGDGTLVIPPVAARGFLGVLAAVCAVCEVCFRRSNGRAVVR